MSRIGKKPISIPAGVEVTMQAGLITAKGAKGTLQFEFSGAVAVEIKDNVVTVQSKTPGDTAMQGMTRTMIANMIEGVSRGYTKELEIQGVGFRASAQGNQAEFLLGYSSPVIMEVPEGIEIKITDNVNIAVSGANKQQVGDVAARIKSFYPVEPYKGKGIRFKGEHVRRKAGKTVA